MRCGVVLFVVGLLVGVTPRSLYAQGRPDVPLAEPAPSPTHTAPPPAASTSHAAPPRLVATFGAPIGYRWTRGLPDRYSGYGYGGQLTMGVEAALGVYAPSGHGVQVRAAAIMGPEPFFGGPTMDAYLGELGYAFRGDLVRHRSFRLSTTLFLGGAAGWVDATWHDNALGDALSAAFSCLFSSDPNCTRTQTPEQQRLHAMDVATSTTLDHAVAGGVAAVGLEAGNAVVRGGIALEYRYLVAVGNSSVQGDQMFGVDLHIAFGTRP